PVAHCWERTAAAPDVASAGSAQRTGGSIATAAAVLPRRHAVGTQELPVEVGQVAVPDARRDGRDAFVGPLQELTGPGEPELAHHVGEGLAAGRLEVARERRLAHGRQSCGLTEPHVVGEVV